MGIFNADLEAKMDHFRDPIFRVFKSDPQIDPFLDGLKRVFLCCERLQRPLFRGAQKHVFTPQNNGLKMGTLFKRVFNQMTNPKSVQKWVILGYIGVIETCQ